MDAVLGRARGRNNIPLEQRNYLSGTELVPSVLSMVLPSNQSFALLLQMSLQSIGPRQHIRAIGAFEGRIEVDGFDVTNQILHRLCDRAMIKSAGIFLLLFVYTMTMPKPHVLFDVGLVHIYEQTTRVVVPLAQAHAGQPCWEVLRSVAICGDIAIIQFHRPKSPRPKWFAAWVKGLAATDVDRVWVVNRHDHDRGTSVRHRVRTKLPI